MEKLIKNIEKIRDMEGEKLYYKMQVTDKQLQYLILSIVNEVLTNIKIEILEKNIILLTYSNN